MYYTDIGAFHHITFEIGNLHLSAPYNGPNPIWIGNDGNLSILNTRTSTYFVGNKELYMNNILHCLDAHFNLLSVRKFACDNSYLFQFDDNSFEIKDKTIGQTLH